MFYDTFWLKCNEKGVSCNRAALDMGLSNATVTAWKKRGSTPSAETLKKIADYFGCTVGELLGEAAETEKTPTPVAQGERHSEVMAAKHELMDQISQLKDQEDIQKLVDYAQYLLSKRNQ